MKWIVLLLGLPAPCLAAEPYATVPADHGSGSPATLRAAIWDLMGDFGPEYPAGEEYLRRLDAIEQQMASGSDSARAAFEQLQRSALLANPLLRAQPILFVVREQYLPDHHNTETIFHTGEPNCGKYRPGGALKFLDPFTGQTSVLLNPGPEGLVRDPEVHFDGRKIVFAMRKARGENYSIYELEVDPQQGWAAVPGSLRRLTNERDATDIDPVYLPHGTIIFSRTREPKYCHCNMPDYACAHPTNAAGRAPLSIAQLNRLAELTGLPLSDGQGNPGFAGHRLWLSFDRPELSPCLRKLDQAGDAYREALAIIRAGQEELRKNPEADMPGFRPCEEHQVREAKYQALRDREQNRRQALSDGRKIFDPDIGVER